MTHPAAGPDAAPRPLRAPDGGFRNPGLHDDRTWLDVLRWKLSTLSAPRHRPPPGPPAPSRPPPSAPARGLSATWIGHSTFLLRTPTLSLLTDPVWSRRLGPAGLPLLARARPPGVSIESLPRIDAILLSHDHYDHCDLPTLRRLAREHPAARLFCPLGHEGLAARAGFGPERLSCLDWWQTCPLAPGATLTATPARHWSNRLSGPRNGRLWCGWHLATHADGALFFAGDTAWDDAMFPAIRRQLGAPHLALLPIGAYAPRWFLSGQHCDPDEAVRIHLALGAHRSLGMHWGTFALTDEPLDEPPVRLAAAARAAGLAPTAFRTLAPGETALTPHSSADQPVT
jgi:L-ascorbate metabolism protein UlaG (beta-lactamase superfamily)